MNSGEGRSEGKRIRLLYLADILKKHSDENHPLTAEKLIERLNEFGVEVKRKAIYGDIELLNDYGMDIIKTRRGYYLASRDFEAPEIYLLADAVQSADFISAKKSRELVHKLQGMLSENEAGEISKRVYIDNRHKCQNEEIFYNIDAASKAIRDYKKLTFKYCRRVLKSGKITVSEKQMTVSPYALVWADDHYYLVCNYEKYDDLMRLRLDRMKKATVTGEQMRDFSEVSEYKNHFDIADYAAKSFSMFGGELNFITLRVENRLLEQIIDRFGDKISVRETGENDFVFKAEALVSEGLVNWIMQFGEQIEVIKPQLLRDALKEKSKNIYSLYK